MSAIDTRVGLTSGIYYLHSPKLNMNKTQNRQGRSSSRAGRRRSFSSSKPQSSGGKYKGGYKGRSSSGRPQNRRGGRGGGRKQPSFDPSKFINTNPVDVKEEVYTPKNTFETFGLNDDLVKTTISLGLITPSPIQDQIIPEILKGKDVIGIAETGTGKTAAFLLPIIEKTLADRSRQTLILAPTRELAIQIKDELYKLARGLEIYSTTCVGGMNIRPQIKSLHRTNHFIIGTPGRVLDLIKRKHIIPENMTTVVLDEADRMLDMGFITDMRAIISRTPDTRETLFFSATMTTEAKRLVNDFMKDPITVSVKKKDVTNSIKQDVVTYHHHDKFETLLNLLKDSKLSRVIIFGSMKHSVAELARELSKHEIHSESIHGNKSHSQRQRALTRFKKGDVRVLVATDVAARGIHVDDVSHVINYDLPTTLEDYIHRIGRTGRGDKKGEALTFVQAPKQIQKNRKY